MSVSDVETRFKCEHYQGLIMKFRLQDLIDMKHFQNLKDMTRKQIEETEKWHRILIRTTMDGFLMTDMQGRLLEVNDAYCRMSGYNANELLAMNITDLEADETNIVTTDHIHKVKARGEERFESLHRRKDGSIFDVEVSVQYQPIGGGVIVAFLRDITQRKRAEERMHQSEERFSNLFSEMVSGCSIQDIICDKQGEPIDYITLDVNKSFERILNVRREDVIGKRASTILPSEELSKWVKIFGKVAIDGHSRPYEQFSPTNNKCFAGVVFSPKRGQFAVTFEDITDRKLSEEKIKASLKEKEIFLKEIHHRVKNNMQIISSLLGLASGTITDKKYVDMFRECQNRINSMSLIHEKLYNSRDIAKIELNDYVRDMTNSLFRSHGVAGKIELILDIENVSLGIDLAIPCGLILNELITNSLKYAFPDDRDCKIKVSAHCNDENMIELIFGDNGVGIPFNIDFRNTHSLGLHLVTILVEGQLHGKIDLDRSIGTEFKIIFKGVK